MSTFVCGRLSETQQNTVTPIELSDLPAVEKPCHLYALDFMLFVAMGIIVKNDILNSVSHLKFDTRQKKRYSLLTNGNVCWS